MSFVFNAVENDLYNWTIIVSGQFSDKSRSLHNKKVKCKGKLDKAVENAVKVLNLNNEQYELTKVTTLQDKKNEIDSFKTPMGRLYLKLNKYYPVGFNKEDQSIRIWIDDNYRDPYIPKLLNGLFSVTAKLIFDGGLRVVIQVWESNNEGVLEERSKISPLFLSNIQKYIENNGSYEMSIYAEHNRFKILDLMHQSLKNEDWKSL